VPKILEFSCRRGGLWSALLMLLMAAPAASGQVELVSKANPPADTNGNFAFNAATSADGRYVAFVSAAPNLVPGQRDDLRLAGYTTVNFFLRDRVAGTTVLINHVPGSSSVASASEGALDSLEQNLRNLDVSADGHYVAYAAHSTGLVPDQVRSAPHADVFLYDRVTGTNTLISHAAGQPAVTGDLASFDPHISADGNYVVFTSRAGDLVAGQSGPGANGAAVYLYNRAAGALTLLSHKSGSPSAAAGGLSIGARISGDGGYVVFYGEDPGLVSGISGATQGNAYLYQRATGAVSLVSHANGAPLTAIGGGAPQISADGRWIAFGSRGVLLQDRLTGLSQLITHSRSSPATAVQVDDFVFSANGNVVVFRSPATDLVAGQADTNGQDDLFAFDRVTGKTVLVSHAAGSQTTASDFGARAGEVSADGRFIAFSSFSRNLVLHQINTVRTGEAGLDAFLYDRSTAATVLVSHAGGSPTTTGNHDSLASGISADGGTVLVGSWATDLAAGDVNPDQYMDLWAYDRRAGDFIPISHRDPGSPAVTPDGPSAPVAISADGRRILFSSLATGLVPGQVDIPFNNLVLLDPPFPSPTRDYFLRDRPTGKTTLLSRSSASPPTAIGGHGAILSADGKFAAFERYDPQTGSSPLVSRLFLYDTDQDRLTVVNRVAGSPSQYAGDAEGASLSADGRYLVFNCSRCQVIAGMQAPADEGQTDLFLYDRVTDGYTLLSHALGSPLRPGNGVSSGTISADGRYVLITSAATDLLAGQTGPAGSNLFLLDRATGALTLVSHVPGNPGRAAAGSFSGNGQISADGRWILFASTATDLVPGQAGGNQDLNLFLYDRTSDTSVLVNHAGSSPVTPAEKGIFYPSMSADGRWIVFESPATDLIPGGSDTNQTTDVFLYDRASGAVTLVSHADGSATTAAPFGGEYPQISADGGRIAFQTPAFILTTGPAVQIVLQDRATGARTIAGEVYPSTPIPTRLNTVPQGPLLSADGRQVAFPSASPLVPGDFNLNWDAYVYDESLGNPVTVPPCALFDGSLRSNLQKLLAVVGSCRVPAGARRVTVQVTARQGSGPGNLRLYPGDDTTTPAGTLRFQKGQTAVSSFDIPLTPDGTGTIAVLPFVRGNGTVRVTVEVDGYTP
jgi:Tol biopolymer transport system component